VRMQGIVAWPQVEFDFTEVRLKFQGK
jgi:hypothetical protein